MRLFTLRGPVLRVPWLLVIAGWAGMRGWLLLRWLAAHGIPTVCMLAVAGLWWLIAAGLWPWLLVAAGLTMAGLVTAMETRPRWYREALEQLASWRRRREYEAGWEAAMDGAGLVLRDVVPTLMAHRWGGAPGERDTDVLTVRMAPGQLVSDWRTQSVRLAAAFGLQRVRCHAVPGIPGDVQLFGRRYRQLTPQATAQRVELHPDAQPAREQMALRIADAMDVPENVVLPLPPSTAVEEPVERQPLRPIPGALPDRQGNVRTTGGGAFPRTPRSDR